MQRDANRVEMLSRLVDPVNRRRLKSFLRRCQRVRSLDRCRRSLRENLRQIRANSFGAQNLWRCFDWRITYRVRNTASGL